jgi:hypothetical protein
MGVFAGPDIILSGQNSLSDNPVAAVKAKDNAWKSHPP